MAAVAQRALSPVHFQSDALPERRFYQVGGRYQDRMRVVEGIFRRILEPLYGSQEKALRQIRESTDRRCFLLYEGRHPVGVLVFKTQPSNEFEEYGVSESIEVKSLFVDQSQNNSGRGLGSELVNKLWIEVEALGAKNSGVHLTVSETKEDSLAFFQKKGFSIRHSWHGRYKKGVVEYLLSCPQRIASAGASVAAVAHGVGALNLDAAEGSLQPGAFRRIGDAHFGRIHTLIPLSDGTFATGSEDNCLYKWSPEGEKVQTVYEVEPTLAKDRDWVTAAAVINDAYWVTGLRSGRISLWTTAGEHVRDIKPRLPSRHGHISQVNNKQRVNCFGVGLDVNRPGLYVGLPTMISEYNWIEGRTASMTKVDDNDWVYCIHPIDQNRMLTVIGGRVDLIEQEGEGFAATTLLPEGKKVRVQKINRKIWQRPFISSLKPLEGVQDQFALTLFDGSVKVMDANDGSIVREWNEHHGRVWTSENLASHQFASCGDDGLIKLWDTRESDSVKTIKHSGQVTSMLRHHGQTLIAGVTEKARRAALFFHDLRV